MEYRVIKIKNGDQLVPYRIYTCKRCRMELEEAWPMEFFNGEVYCGDCAFINGFINEQEYIKDHAYSIGLKNVRAVVHDGEVWCGVGKFPWEKTKKDIRRSKEYDEWRASVFERDGYKCAICQKVGGTLNAHHIKPFNDFEAERFNVDNGVTLCEPCHRKVHREKDPNWIKG